MSERFRIGTLAEMPEENRAKEFRCGPRMVCIARVNGELAALDNVCIHRGGALGQGTVQDGKVICPWHGWGFDVKTGNIEHSGAPGVKVYAIHVDGESVFVEL